MDEIIYFSFYFNVLFDNFRLRGHCFRVYYYYNGINKLNLSPHRLDHIQVQVVQEVLVVLERSHPYLPFHLSHLSDLCLK